MLPKPGEVIPGHKTVTDFKGPDLEPETKVVPWTESAYLGEGPIRQQEKNPKVWGPTSDQAMIDQLHQGLPDPVRRTSRERYETLVVRLNETARATKQAYGYVRWPVSVQKVLDELGLKATASDREQVYALARHYILKAENQQRRKDAKKVVSDWHGHFD